MFPPPLTTFLPFLPFPPPSCYQHEARTRFGEICKDSARMYYELEDMGDPDQELAKGVRFKLMQDLAIISNDAVSFSQITRIRLLTCSSLVFEELFKQLGGVVLKALPLLRWGGGVEHLAILGRWCDDFGEERRRRCQVLKTV